MANLTIRKLDDAIRDELRLRAARNGRSVEDEVRVILRDASQHGPSLAASASQAVSQRPATAPRGARDAAGNAATSSTVTATVANSDTSPPTVVGSSRLKYMPMK